MVNGARVAGRHAVLRYPRAPSRRGAKRDAEHPMSGRDRYVAVGGETVDERDSVREKLPGADPRVTDLSGEVVRSGR